MLGEREVNNELLRGFEQRLVRKVVAPIDQRVQQRV